MTGTPSKVESGALIGGRYRVERELGAGGFGTTYAAIDEASGEQVAVKVLDLHRVDSWKAVELFEREARVLQTLEHPGIPAYVEFRPVEAEKQAFLVQTLAPGQDLLRALQTRRFTEDDLRDLTERMLHILQYLGERHPVVVHRDIKPANILIDESGTISLVDFGAVRDVARVTLGGGSTIAGTFGYMAPEQLQGEANPSSDLYGLGMTLIHLASGRSPADFDKRRLKPDFKPHIQLSDGFEAFIDRLIEPVPDDRYQSADDALAALRKLARDEREAADDPLSAEHIAAKRAEAQKRAEKQAREKRRRSADSKPAKKRRKKRPDNRLSFIEDSDGATLEIRPERYWRGREAHFGILSVFGLVGAVVPLGSAYGALGVLGGILGVIALGAILWLIAPTWRVRMTRAGDFIFYARSPRRPKWIGRLDQLRIKARVTASHDYILDVAFKESKGKQYAKHFYPIIPGDKGTLTQAQQWRNRHKERK